MTDEKLVKSPRGRIKRASQVPLGPLSVRGKHPDFVYRVVNDIGDRISEVQEIGYEVVSDKDVSIGEKRVDRASTLGSAKTFSVGGGVKGVLMRQKKEWWDEDQEAHEAQIAKQEQAFKRDALDGTYGSLKTSRE